MTRASLTSYALATALALALALVLSSSYLLDEIPVSQSHKDAIEAMKLEQRIEAAAKALCEVEQGIGASHRWDQDGSLVCVHPLDRRALAAGL